MAGDQAIARCHRTCAVRAEGPVSAIVQQDHVSASNLARHLSLDVLGRRRVPVVAGHIPHDWFQSHLSRDAEYHRATAPERRAEQIGVFSHGVGQRVFAVRELRFKPGAALENEQRMGESMVAYDVTSLHYFTSYVRALPDVAADQEKRGANIVPRQNLKQAKGV